MRIVFSTPKIPYPPIAVREAGEPEPAGSVRLAHLGGGETSARVYDRATLLAGDQIDLDCPLARAVDGG